MSDPSAHYAATLVARRRDLARVERLSFAISMARLAAFLLGVSSLAARAFAHAPAALYAAGALLVAFVVLVIWHAKVAAEEARLASAIVFAERGLHRLAGDLEKLPPRGGSLADPPPYATDLDLVGPRSLLALLDAMETDASEARLFGWLSRPALPDEVRARQAAAAELAAHPETLSALFVGARAGARSDRDLAAFVGWCRDGRAPPAGAALRVLGVVIPLTTLTLALFSERLGASPSLVLVPVVLSWAISLAIALRADEGLLAAQRGARALGRHGATLDALLAITPRSPRLAAVAERLAVARSALRSLDSIASWVDPRENPLFRTLIGPLVLYDVHLTLALSSWRAAHGAKVDGWLDDLADLLALAGVAVLRFDRPDYAFPAVEDGPLRFVAEGLAHPLVSPSARVANDVRFDGPGTALLVTGSNMSGKSTLLRAVGSACVMAQAGAPVCATALSISPLLVRSSIRVSDSLAAGVSHFYAELLALKLVVDDADRGAPVLFLLDEILHGTNSRERQTGAKSVVAHLLAKGAMGAVSTHDVGLASLVDEHPGLVRAVHLVEQAEGERMTFDYRLRDGILTSGNALKLMKSLGLPVDVTS